MNLLEYDLNAMGPGPSGLIGLDEVGRGCLAGPIVVGACYLSDELIAKHQSLLLRVNDSKKLSDKKRRQLSAELLETDIPFLLIYVPASEVDRLNPLRATMDAMRKLIVSFLRAAGTGKHEWKMVLHINKILIDGNEKPTMGVELKTVVSGDGTSAAIACASIVAKVERDTHMEALHERYPVYGFANHAGYGTKEHNEALLMHGPCREHRRTFSVAGKKIAELEKERRD